jgi:hypothetical protein
MQNSQPKYLALLATLLTVLVLFIVSISRPRGAKAIKRAFQATEYEKITPLLIAQSRHETANFTSNVYKNAHNLFGMCIPTRRNSTRKGEYNSYSKYKSDLDSAKDMLIYLRYTAFPTENMDAYDFALNLKDRNYYEDSFGNYFSAIVKWLMY